MFRELNKSIDLFSYLCYINKNAVRLAEQYCWGEAITKCGKGEWWVSFITSFVSY